MKNIGLLSIAVGCLCAVASVSARETIRVHFELYKNSKQAAAPTVAVRNAETGALDLGNKASARIAFTPSRIDEHKIGVAFKIVNEGKTLRPRVVLLKNESGWVSWKAGSDSFDLRVFVIEHEPLPPR